MLKNLLNECEIDLIIHSKGPLLIKTGFIDAKGLDMNFVRTLRNGSEEIYIPGSSLKGLVRSHSEKIVRSLSNASPKCCNPFEKENKNDHTMACSEKFKKRKSDLHENILSAEIYADSCPICKIFGSTSQSSRFSIEDAYLVTPTDQESKRQQRDGIGIDRFTGGTAGGAKFEMEVFSFLEFNTKIYIRNFEVWHLGLLAYVLNDFQNGLARIGYGKSRGLGKFKIDITAINIAYLNPNIQENLSPHNPELFGMKNLSGDPDYDFFQEEINPILVENVEAQRRTDEIGLRKTYFFDNKTSVSALFKTVAPLFNNFIAPWNWKVTMQADHFIPEEETHG